MTLHEVAEYLKLSEKTVSRMAQEGRIPAQKLARQWRFQRSVINQWMADPNAVRADQQQLPPEATGLPQSDEQAGGSATTASRDARATTTASRDARATTTASRDARATTTASRDARATTAALRVANAINPNRINLALTAPDKNGVLRELCTLVIDPREERLFDTLLQALKAREDLCPTCVTEGVAIPHARNALIGLVDNPVLAYGRHDKGVDFGALDGKPVHHFFLLCAPNVRQHLQLLSRLSRLVTRADFLARLMAAHQPDDVVALFREVESNIPGA